MPLSALKRRGRAGLLLVPLLGLLWGFNWPAVKIVLGELPPWSMRSIGLISAGFVLVLFARLRGQSLSVERAHWLRLFVSSVLTIALMNVSIAFAQMVMATSRTTIVTFTMPLWTAILAWFLLGERLSGRGLIGLSLGLAGLAALAFPLVRDGQLSLGILYALIGGFGWALGTVVSKGWPVKASPLAIAAWQLLIGGSCALTGALIFEGFPPAMPQKAATWAALAYHVLLSQAVAYVIWFDIVARMPAGVAAIGILMVPAVGFLSAMALLGEAPSLGDAVGLVLIIAGAASVMIPRRQKPVPQSG